jgi:hypothetical protein
VTGHFSVVAMNQPVVESHCEDEDGLGGVDSAALSGARFISETSLASTSHQQPATTKSIMPSLLRNPILRLRRRRHTEKSSTVISIVEVPPSSVSTLLELQERGGGVFEEAKVEKTEIRLAPRGSSRLVGGISRIEISVDEDHHDATFYHNPTALLENSCDDRSVSSTPREGGRIMAGEYGSLSHQSMSHQSKLARKSIMKYRDSNLPRKNRFQRTGQKCVSFDESTIVPRHDKRNVMDNIALAMPAILPYLIAVLILILSSLVPPDPNVSGRIVNSKKRHDPWTPRIPPSVGSQSAPPMTMSTTALTSTTPSSLFNSNHLHSTTSGGNSYFELSKISTEPPDVDDSEGQNTEEGPLQLLYEGPSQEIKSQERRQILDNSDAQLKLSFAANNPFVRVWRAIKRKGNAPSPR